MIIAGNQNYYFAQFPRYVVLGILGKEEHVAGKKKSILKMDVKWEKRMKLKYLLEKLTFPMFGSPRMGRYENCTK